MDPQDVKNRIVVAGINPREPIKLAICVDEI